MGVKARAFMVNIMKPDSWTRRGNGVETGAELTAPSLDQKTLPDDTLQQISAAEELRLDGLFTHSAGRLPPIK